MARCNWCWMEVAEDARFCRHCGTARQGSPHQTGLPELEEPATRRKPRIFHLWIFLPIIGLLLACAIFAPLLAPRDPDRQDLRQARTAPLSTSEFPLGSDHLGRDILSRLVYGARTTLFLVLASFSLSILIGVPAGIAAAFVGGARNSRILGAARALAIGSNWKSYALTVGGSYFFFFYFAILGGSSAAALVVWLGITGFPRVASMAWNMVVAIRTRTPAPAGRYDDGRIGRQNIRAMPSMILALAAAIMAHGVLATVVESIISFQGFGPEFNQYKSWGLMAAQGRNYLFSSWWMSWIPLACIVVTAVALHLVGRWLRDTLELRLPGVTK